MHPHGGYYLGHRFPGNRSQGNHTSSRYRLANNQQSPRQPTVVIQLNKRSYSRFGFRLEGLQVGFTSSSHAHFTRKVSCVALLLHVAQSTNMTTLPSLVMRSPSSPILRPLAGYDPPSSSAVVILVSLKQAPRNSTATRSARSRVRSSRPEHEHRFLLQSRGTRFQNANGELDVARKARARSLRCKAQVDSAELEVAEETNGAAVHRNESEERLLPTKQSGDAREIRLKSVRGADFAGASISSQVWEWRHRWNIHYESAGMENTDAPALLLLPGFGVGSYHYEHQLRDLGQEYRVWAMDFLGQGKSWPSHDPAPLEEVLEEVVEGQVNAKPREWCSGKNPEAWATDLVYSVDTWRDQVHALIDKVIGGPVYIVGNSLGGYVGTYFAAANPELVKGLVLLNATPFWAFMPNARRYPFLSRFVPWAGLLPVPVVAKAAVRVWWNLLRNPKVIRRALEMVYADDSAFNDKLVRQMVEATDHPAAFAAFASILFAPRAHTDFGENLISLKERKTPMCMIYGKEDPWVVPFWGQRTKQRNPDAVYYELSPAGHCPHHEAPEVLTTLLRKWVESVQSQGALSPLLLEAGVDQKQRHWFVVENPKAGFDDKRVSVRVKGTQGFWKNLLDSIREIFSKRISPQSQVLETVERTR